MTWLTCYHIEWRSAPTTVGLCGWAGGQGMRAHANNTQLLAPPPQLGTPSRHTETGANATCSSVDMHATIARLAGGSAMCGRRSNLWLVAGESGDPVTVAFNNGRHAARQR